MPKKVTIEVHGLDHYVFRAEEGTRVLSLFWDFYSQEWHPFTPRYHSDYTTYKGKCYDLRKPSNHKFFHKNLAYFFEAVGMTANAIKLGHSHPKTLILED